MDASRPTAADNPNTLVDSSNATFGWICDSLGCVIVPEPNTPPIPPCEVGQVGGYGFMVGRFVTILGSCDNASFGNWQRPVACVVDNDCPQLYQFSDAYRFECRQGLCQNADRVRFALDVVIEEDAFRLCYGPFARQDTLAFGTTTGESVTAWVNSACRDGLAGRCTLPLPGQCLNP